MAASTCSLSAGCTLPLGKTLASCIKNRFLLVLMPSHFSAVLWTPESEEQAVLVAASRISCIVLSVLIMALLAMLIYPQIASEQVAQFFPSLPLLIL